MNKEFDAGILAVQKEKKEPLRRFVEASGLIDAVAKLYGLATGSTLAIVVGLTGLVAKAELLQSNK